MGFTLLRQLISMNGRLSSLVKNCIFCFFVFIFAILVVRGFLVPNVFLDYVFQEWMINYSHGFIRRGLSGTFLLFIQKQYNVDIYTVIQYFAYFTFLLFSFIYILKVRQSKKILNWETMMVVLFLPSLIMFPINDLRVIGRKEFFFFFGLLINLFFLEKTFRTLNANRYLGTYLNNPQRLEDSVNKYCSSLFFWYNLLAIPTALSHEAIIFLAVPLNMVITSSLVSLAFSKRQILLRTIIIYLPTIIVSFICLIFKGNREVVLGICQSWQEYSHIYITLSADCSNQLPDGLYYLSRSTLDAIKDTMLANVLRHNGLVFFGWVFTFFLNTVILMRTSSRILTNSVINLKHEFLVQDGSDSPSSVNSVDIVTSFSFKYAFIPFIFSFILYVLALDWGRWFFITSITYTLCLLSPGLIRMELANYHRNKWMLKFASPIYSTYSKFVYYLNNQYLFQRFSTIYYVILSYTLFVMIIPHINMNKDNFYASSNLYRSLVYIYELCKHPPIQI